MKFLFITLSALFLFACSGEKNEINENGNNSGDTLESGIIEYDLNEEKLSAVDFNNELALIQQNVWNQLDSLFMADSTDIENQFETTIFEVDTKLMDLRQMGVPVGGEKLSSALINLLMYYQTELNLKFKPLLPILKKPIDQITREEAGKLTEFDLAFAAKEKELVLEFTAEQDAFAAANNFKMQEL